MFGKIPRSLAFVVYQICMRTMIPFVKQHRINNSKENMCPDIIRMLVYLVSHLKKSKVGLLA